MNDLQNELKGGLDRIERRIVRAKKQMHSSDKSGAFSVSMHARRAVIEYRPSMFRIDLAGENSYTHTFAKLRLTHARSSGPLTTFAHVAARAVTTVVTAAMDEP